METMGLLLEQGPTYKAVLCPGDLDLAGNIQIPSLKAGQEPSPAYTRS